MDCPIPYSEKDASLRPFSEANHTRRAASTFCFQKASIEQKDSLENRVFPTTTNAIRLAWEKLTTRAGIDDLHFHDLRHEAISRLFEKGLTVPEVASISGHRDIRMMMRYAHAQTSAVLGKLDGDADHHGIQGTLQR